MATAKGKRATAKKKTTAKQSSSKRGKASGTSKQKGAAISMPALGMVVLTLSILMLFCLISKSNALFIISIRMMLRGTFGVLSVPIVMLLMLLGLQTAFGDRWPVNKLVWSQLLLLLFLVATLLQVFRLKDLLSALHLEGYLQNFNGFLWKSYEVSKFTPEGGGAFGALLAFPMGRYLDIVGSAMVLVFGIIGTVVWMVRTLVPSAGPRIVEWIGRAQEDFAQRREEHAAEREQIRAEREQQEQMRIQREKTPDAILTPFPPELTTPEMPPPPPEEPARVARGRRQPKTPPPPPQQQQPNFFEQPVELLGEPDDEAALDGYARAELEWNARNNWAQETASPSPAPASKERRKSEPDPGPPARPVKRSTRLYIENPPSGAQSDARLPTRGGESAERYAPPSHSDPDALPEFVLRRREQYDAEYGRSSTQSAEAENANTPRLYDSQSDEMPKKAAVDYGADMQDEEAAGESGYAPHEEYASYPADDAYAQMEQEAFGHEEETRPYYSADADAPDTAPSCGDAAEPYQEPAEPIRLYSAENAPSRERHEPQSTPDASEIPLRRRGAIYSLNNYQDRQPELEPQTRLDRPDWKPPEPEVVETTPDAVEYRHPPFTLLVHDEKRRMIDTRDEDARGAQKLEETLASFGVSAHVIRVVHGPAVTRYELQPAPGVKVSKIVNLTDDIALNMAALGVRIEAPIPGKAAIGIEIANDEIQTVFLRDVLESDESRRNPSKLAVALGKDIAGKRIIADLARMPHLLIAGATGSGKSVCINTLITSMIYRSTPEEVRLILIDPKKVELAVYNGIPHLLVPVVTDPKKASGALAWAVMEMDERYKRFAEIGVREIRGYNAHRPPDTPLMPQIVVIIDELSDLMLVAPGEVEESICRLAQLARACGIHLVIATQRPSVNVITGIIKANIPSRIAFAVSSQVDSRTILDSAGAEKLLGKGDMLYAPSGGGKPLRVQGCFVSDDEVARVVQFVKDRHETDYSQDIIEAIDNDNDQAPTVIEDSGDDTVDPLFEQAVEMAIDSGQASISMLQRRLKVGYARAGRLIDEMARREIISQSEGTKPREVLMTREEFRVQFGK